MVEYRTAHFQMSDGSPSFHERQRLDESDEDFMIRCLREVKQGGGYVSLADVTLTRSDAEFVTEFWRRRAVG